jgi:hypothetical protein
MRMPARASRAKRAEISGLSRSEEEFEGDELVELAMAGGEDYAHAAFSKDAG